MKPTVLMVCSKGHFQRLTLQDLVGLLKSSCTNRVIPSASELKDLTKVSLQTLTWVFLHYHCYYYFTDPPGENSVYGMPQPLVTLSISYYF